MIVSSLFVSIITHPTRKVDVYEYGQKAENILQDI